MIGIICGALCALAHSLCYLFTRGFLVTPGRSSYQLISLGHVYMAVFALAGLPFCWQTPYQGWGKVLFPLMGTAAFYFLAQFLFFRLVTWAPASRVSPLLGVKIIPLAGLAVLLTGAELGVTQWCAVGVCLLAALVLARGGGDKLPLKAIVVLGMTVCCYAMSDTCIARTLQALSPEKSWQSSMFALSMTYLLCGLPGIYWLFSKKMSGGRKGWAEWKGALGYSLSWYAAMIFLFVAIALIGVVPAIMLQAGRGPLSVGLGLLVASLGHQQLEKKLLMGDALKYVGAALLMCVSIALYFWR